MICSCDQRVFRHVPQRIAQIVRERERQIIAGWIRGVLDYQIVDLVTKGGQHSLEPILQGADVVRRQYLDDQKLQRERADQDAIAGPPQLAKLNDIRTSTVADVRDMHLQVRLQTLLVTFVLVQEHIRTVIADVTAGHDVDLEVLSLFCVQAERRGFAAVEFKYDSATRAIESFIGGQSLKKKRRLNSIRSVVSEDPDLPQTSWLQVSRYALEFEDRTTTTSRFVLAKVREFGEDESEITPTTFSYSSPEFEWHESPYSLPQGIAFARRHELAGAYRFVRFSEQSNNLPDLLVAAQIDGKLDAFAYQNKGNGQWDAVKGFNPPFGSNLVFYRKHGMRAHVAI